MRIVIIGAGEVGYYLALTLSLQNHEVILIEKNEEIVTSLSEELNAKVICNNGTSASVLMDIDIESVDFFLSMTHDDVTNICACSIAKSLGANYTVARIHQQTFAESSVFNYQVHFGIDYLINPEALCAYELAKNIRHPGRVAIESFAKGQIEVQQIIVTEESKLTYRPLADLKLGSDVRVAYILRDDTVRIPTASDCLEPGDQITLVGSSEAFFNTKSRLNPESKYERKRVCILGASETGLVLAKLLTKSRFLVRIIEKNRKRCEQLANTSPELTIIHGDGTSLKLLQEEQIGECDYFIACTKDDEDNIMTCIQVKQLGVKHAQLVINKSDYEELLERIKGIISLDVGVSPKTVSVKDLLKYITTNQYTELCSIAEGKFKIIELLVGLESPSANKLIKEITWPAETLAVGLLHKFNAKVPGADDKILSGDHVVVLTREDQVENIVKLIC